MRNVSLLVLFILHSSNVLASSEKFSKIILAPTQKSESCVGGSLEGITKIATSPDNVDVTSGFSTSKVKPGKYIIQYSYIARKKSDDGCFESGGPKNRKKFEMLVEAGTVYQLSLKNDLSIKIEELDKIPITNRFVAGIYQMVGSMQMWRGICSNLFLQMENKYKKGYDTSSVPKYAKLFGLESNYNRPINIGKTKKDKLETIGQTDEQSKYWCNTEYYSSLEKFDYSYEDRFSDVKKFLDDSTNNK